MADPYGLTGERDLLPPISFDVLAAAAAHREHAFRDILHGFEVRVEECFVVLRFRNLIRKGLFGG